MKPLHDKKHTLAKRGLSLLCILALCLGLLPTTALAAVGAPYSLYVGNQQVIVAETVTYWSTDNSGGLTRVENANDTSNNWNVKYDPNSATLTLSWATITGNGDIESTSQDAGIYALCSQGQSVTLTIKLIGENTITGSYGIYVDAQQGVMLGANASLLIKNGNESGESGRLEVSGSNHGIYVKSGTGDASLTINDVSVVASSSSSYPGYAGVYVQSGSDATSSPQLSLAVNGGSLTTSASEGNDGIWFYVGSSEATGATTSLTVTENAIVDARNGGISAKQISNPINTDISATGSNGGIVFDGSAGTVYGNVELQKDLEIKSGETLTVPDGSKLDCNNNLTNNGTILASGGTVTGNLSGGTAVTTPNITEQPTGQTVIAGSTTTFAVTASDVQSYQWQQSVNGGNNWTNIVGATAASYTIDNTTTDMSNYQYRCVVTSASGVSVTSNAATLTVNSVPVTGVTLDENTLELFTGNTATLTATVEPDNATNKNVTWSSDNADVATVENGKVTAKAAGTATITVTTEDGSYTATCTVTVTDKTYTISADTTALNFGSAYTGYAQPAAKTVTVKNTGNQPVTLNQPTADNYVIGMLSATTLEPNATATFTVQPKAGLAPGNYDENILITGSSSASASVATSFTVRERPYIPPTPPTVSEETTDAIADAQPGETVTVDLSSGSTKLDKDVFETLAGQDITLEIALEGGVTWSVNGTDIPADANLDDLDLGVEMDSDGIPVDVVNSITGEHGSVQMTLAHDGAFGFTMTLTAPLGVENAGYWANLYHYDEDAEALNFETAAEIDADGNAALPLSHASQYAIVIDTHSHATVDVSDIFLDVAPNAWYKDAVQYAYDSGLMTGVSATEFAPEQTTTRAMIVSILARLEGVTTAEAAGFADVNDNDWYATAVNWAASVGVVNGYEDNTFQPNTAITREQLAAILMNYAAYKGEDVSNRADLTSYTDQPSTWATETMSWAVAEGLISGVTADTLQPQGAATRAQVAAILQRFLSE